MPEHIRSDNGPEFIAKAIRDWLTTLGVKTLTIEPASPWENGFTESFNSRLRDELLRVEQFANAAHARSAGVAWREDYNDYRPHGSLDGLPPSEFARHCAAGAEAQPCGSSTAIIYPFPLTKHNSHYTRTKNGGTSRPHSRGYSLGKTPRQTFLDSKQLVKQKMLDQLVQSSPKKWVISVRSNTCYYTSYCLTLEKLSERSKHVFRIRP